MRQSRAAAVQPAGDPGGVRPGVVAALDDDPMRVHVRVAGARGGPAPARIALAVPYRPAEGDRVLVAGEGELYVIGVLHTSSPPALPLPDGGSVRVEDGVALIADREGRVLVRYAEGVAEIAAPAGDLTLAAPAGRVVIRSALDVEVEAGRDITHRAARQVELGAGPRERAAQVRVGAVATSVEAERLSVKAAAAEVDAGRASVLAREIVTRAELVSQTAERFEVRATRLYEQTRDAFREAADLAETRAGRARTLVKEVYALYTGRTAMVSTEETSIDGSKVLLG